MCDVNGIDEGDDLELRVEEGLLRDLTKGTEKLFNPLSPMMSSILGEGGLVPYIKKYKQLRVGR